MVVAVTLWHHGHAACLQQPPRRAVSMLWPWGERVDIEVPTAVCTARMIYAMAHVAADAPAALQREQ